MVQGGSSRCMSSVGGCHASTHFFYRSCQFLFSISFWSLFLFAAVNGIILLVRDFAMLYL